MKNAYRLLSLFTYVWVAACLPNWVQAKTPPPISIRYVKPVASGTGDGTSWANASSDLQAMIDASVAGTEVWVAAGTYKPTAYPAGCTNCSSPRDYTFLLKNGVKLYGGFAGTTEISTSGRNFVLNETILSGEIGDQSTIDDNCYHVVISSNDDASTLIDGFTITKGNGLDESDYIFYDGNYAYKGSGTGLYLNMSSTTVNNIVFKNNGSYYGALAIESDNTAPVTLPLSNATPTAKKVKSQKTKTAPAKHNRTATPPQRAARTAPTRRAVGTTLATSTSAGATISNCTFEDNVGYYGGAVELEYTEGVSFLNCTFKRNTSDGGYGGAVYVESDYYTIFDGCTFEENTGDETYGGALYLSSTTSPVVKNSTFKKNISTDEYYGGAIYFEYYYGNPKIENCTFEENEAGQGGAIYNEYGYDQEDDVLDIDRCVFKKNKAYDESGSYGYGGAIMFYDSYQLNITNSLFDGNVADGLDYYGAGSAVYAAYVTLTMTNCTMVNNAATNTSGVISGYDYDYYELEETRLTNCIFWGNTDDGSDPTLSIIYTDNNSLIEVRSSNVQGGLSADVIDGGGNLDVDPLFVDAPNGNFRLSGSSPLKDQGSNAYASGLDLDGNPRIANVTVDMGAYENQCAGAAIPTALSVTGGGDVCPGSNGVAVGLASSQTSVNYQLKNGSNNVGNAVAGTGSAISFGNQTTAGTYTVVATNTAFGCTNNMSGSATVTVRNPVGGTASADQNICNNTAPNNLTLSGNVGNVTKWQRATNANFTGASDISVTSTTLMGSTIGNLSTDTWFRAVVQAGTCTPVNSSAVKITVLQSVSASILGSNVACTGTSLALTASPSGAGLSYTWSGPGNFSSSLSSPVRNNLTAAMSGVYRLTVARPSCGFSSTASVSVVVTAPNGKTAPRLKALLLNGTVAGLGNVYSVCNGGPVMATVAAIGGTAYSWNGPNGSSGVGSLAVTAPPVMLSNAANANTAGNYTMTIFNGCDRSVTINFSIRLRNCTSTRLAADESTLDLNIGVAPNPVRDLLTTDITGIQGDELRLSLHDAQGRSLQQVAIEAAEGKAQHRFDLRSLPAGMYLLQAETETQRAVKKVIKL
jgi:hypothetical protein